MTGKGFLVLLVAVGVFLQVKSQNKDFETIISRGVADYESGKYESALSWFNQAYKLDRSSDLACYELALTYLALKDDQSAALYSSKVIDKGGEYVEDAYLINGSAWENLGRTEKARRIYKEALKKYPDNYLLHYDMALSFFNARKYDKALEHVVNAIEIYPAHASSHLLLAYVSFENGERVQSMLPLYYFLLLEQDSDRSLTAYNMLSSLWNQGVRQKGQRDIQLVKSGYKYNDFASAELAVSMINAGASVSDSLNVENMPETRNSLLAKFVSNSKVLFKILEEESVGKNGFWWDFYGVFFAKVERNDLSESLSYFISACRFNDDVLLWMSDNHKEFQRFTNWMEVQ